VLQKSNALMQKSNTIYMIFLPLSAKQIELFLHTNKLRFYFCSFWID